MYERISVVVYVVYPKKGCDAKAPLQKQHIDGKTVHSMLHSHSVIELNLLLQLLPPKKSVIKT